MMRVVDFSEYQRLPNQAWFNGLVTEHGVRGVVIQAWGGGPNSGRRNDYYHMAMQRAKNAGLKLATYVWPSEDVGRGGLDYIDTSGGLPPDWVGLDVEAGSRPLDRDPALVEARGYIPVAYTFPHYWGVTIGNPKVWGELPLWLSRGYYSNSHPNRQRVWWPTFYDPFGSYVGRVGAWSRAIGWQFQGTTALTAGGQTVGVDLNVFREWPTPTQQPEPVKEAEEDTMKLVKTQDSRSVWLVGGGVRKHIANPQTLGMLQYMMSIEQGGGAVPVGELDWEFLRRTTTELGRINLVGWKPNG